MAREQLTPLNPDEALAAMKAGERLVNGNEPWHEAQYKWFKGEILKFDSWYDLYGDGEYLTIAECPQLYRRTIVQSGED